MKKIIRKSIVSLLAITLVFSSVSYYEFQSDNVLDVQATEFIFDSNPAKLIAVVLAALGLKITSDVLMNDMNDIYNNLNENAQTVINTFDYATKYNQGFWALTEDQIKILSSGLVNVLDAFNMTPGQSYYSNGGIATDYVKLALTYSLINSSWSDGIAYGIYKEAYIGTTKVSECNVTRPNFGGSINICGVSMIMPTYTTNFNLLVDYGVFLGSQFYNYATYGYVATNYYVGRKIQCIGLNSDGITMCNSGNNNRIDRPHNTSTGALFNYPATAEMLNAISLMLYGGGLTLPAPLGGWEGGQPGDIDVPSDWAKRITTALGLPLVVLGGLGVQDLLDLKNKGPMDVTTGADLPLSVQDTFTGAGAIPDTGVDVYDPAWTFPDINIGEALGDLAGWLGGALGALSGVIAGGITAVLGWLKSIGKTLTDLLALVGGMVTALITGLTLAMTNVAEMILAGFGTLIDSALLPFAGFHWPDITGFFDFIRAFFIALWEILKFLLSLFQYLFTWFITLLNILYNSFFVGLVTTLFLMSTRIKSLLEVLPNPIDDIAILTYDLALFGMVLAILKNVLYIMRAKK